MSAKTGPKAPVTLTALNIGNARKNSRKFDLFCRQYFFVKGKAGPQPLKPRKWQTFIVASFFDSKQVRLAGLQIGRGNGKSTLLAAIALWNLFTTYGADVVCCATDERQAGIIYDIARYAIEHSPALSARALIYKDKITVPGLDATLRVLPAKSDSLEGLNYSLAILDEAGFANKDTFATLLDAQGKRDESILVLIGTPGPASDSPLASTRDDARTSPDDPLTAWVEFSADDYRSHPWDCLHCLQAANPAYADFLFAAGVDASRPPKVPEARWRRVRLGQWVTGSGDQWIDRADWDECQDARVILPGSPVVLAIDGSRVEDSTALVMVSVEAKPIVQLVQLWEPHLEGDDYRVPVLDVERKIIELADIFNVREVTGDPFGWSRTFEVLKERGLPVTEFPNTRERTTPAVAAFKTAVAEQEISHDGSHKLAAHISNAVMDEWARGYTIRKASPHSKAKIDAAICAVMGLTRAKWHAAQKPKATGFRKVEIRR